jgi:hypothetical protein
MGHCRNLGCCIVRHKFPQRTPKKTILILCEGHIEVAYFKIFCAGHSNVTVEIGSSCPLNLAEEALERSNDFTKVICVFDHDNDNNFPKAVDKIKGRATIINASSVMCFEIWFLLHFVYSTAPANCCKDVLKKLRHYKGFENYEKQTDINWFKKLSAHLQTAISNAKKLEKTGEKNPATTIHHAIQYLQREFASCPT